MSKLHPLVQWETQTHETQFRVTEYQPAERVYHRSNIVRNKLYVWSGDRPVIHISEAKQSYNSRVEILDITGNWRQYSTTGNPPLDFIDYASAVIDNNIIIIFRWMVWTCMMEDVITTA